MQEITDRPTLDRLSGSAYRLSGGAQDYDPLLELIGDARLVLLGEASHGTHDFYHERAQITQRLIQEKDFTAVAVEADWPDAYRVNRYVRAIGVIYRPETERASHYFYAQLPRQFDAVLHFDETRAVEPLERNAEWEKGELPETYPFGV